MLSGATKLASAPCLTNVSAGWLLHAYDSSLPLDLAADKTTLSPACAVAGPVK
ncbi:hypothetical protein D3C72_2583130 [compost metagenome]